MTRARSFCRYCGAVTSYLDGCCAAHRGLLALETPPSQWENLPMQAAEVGEAVQAARETGA